MIWNEQQAVTEMVEECTTPLVPNCLQPGPEVCRTVYDTVCDTKQVGYEVEEQFPNCVTVNMEKCKDVTIGLVTENKCEVWPVQQCEVENRTVTHTQPRTDCRKEPRELCAPGDCPLEEGPVVCAQKMKTVVVDTPEERCDLEPQQVCKQVTKLVPQLRPAKECVQVPKEVCATSRVNPSIRKVPFIQKWCFDSKDASLSAVVRNQQKHSLVDLKVGYHHYQNDCMHHNFHLCNVLVKDRVHHKGGEERRLLPKASHHPQGSWSPSKTNLQSIDRTLREL